MIDKKQVLWALTDNEDKLFLSRMCDIAHRSMLTGRIMYSKFLSPREQMLVQNRLSNYVDVSFFGGFEGAQRRICAFVPTQWEEIEYQIRGIEIIPSDKKPHTHRDYLGSLLSLGIVREHIGDIVVMDKSAVVIVTDEIADFVMMNLSRIARTSTRTEIFDNISTLSGSIRTQEESQTVASLRLDCVVSAITKKSRADSQSLVELGLVSLNYNTEKRASLQVKTEDVIAIKGYGKAIIKTDGSLTKKGRHHIIIERYI